jgi:hypothetical protein
VKLKDLVGELLADDLADKEYVIKLMLTIVKFIDEHDVGLRKCVNALLEGREGLVYSNKH